MATILMAGFLLFMTLMPGPAYSVTAPSHERSPSMAQTELSWSTYLGGSDWDVGYGVAMDKAGNSYVTGETRTPGWVASGHDTTQGGESDAFVVKLAPTGQPLWSTYLGGDLNDWGTGIAVDGAGNVCVTGVTFSTGWVSGGFNVRQHYPSVDGFKGFVVKLSGTGQHLWSTYLGGEKGGGANGIAVDGAGDIYVTGTTNSPGWLSMKYDTPWMDSEDAYAVKLTSAGQMVWGANLGGLYEDYGNAIAVDGSGNVYVAGTTLSPGWVSGGWRTSTIPLSNYDIFSYGFVAKLTPDGKPAWSSYLGGSNFQSGWSGDTATAIAVDNAGNSWVVGRTLANNWMTGGYNPWLGGTQDAYVVHFSSTGEHIWSTNLGGSGIEEGCGVALDAKGNAYVTGMTCASKWNWISSDIDGTFNSSAADLPDAFLFKLSPTGQSLWSTYIGGAGSDYGLGVATDGVGHTCVTGRTDSAGWTAGGYNTNYGGGTDGFAALFTDVGRVEKTGTLSVSIQPEAAVAAGAQWRRLGTSVWHASGASEVGVPFGAWKLEFKTVPGWTPPSMFAWVPEGQSLKATGTYRPGASLQVILGPPEAVAAGAKWRRMGTFDWHDSGDVEIEATPCTVTLEFKPAPLWTPPNPRKIPLTGGQATTVSVDFTPAPTALSWLTTLGGAYDDFCYAMALDGAGNIYLTGKTYSPAGWAEGADLACNTYGSIFVVKLSPEGKPIWYDTLGGKNDSSNALALDKAGYVYVTGSTTAEDWAFGGYDQSLNGHVDAFVVKLTPDGKHVWSTYVGGIFDDIGNAVAVNATGEVFVAGTTDSRFPAWGWAKGGYNVTPQGGRDGFIVKISAGGQHVWSTYLGGNADDEINTLKIGPGGNLCVAGYTCSENLVTSGSGAGYHGGSADGFIATLSPANGKPSWITCLGGVQGDWITDLSLDSKSNICITGYTDSPNWAGNDLNSPTGVYTSSARDAFVAKLNAAGQWLWGAYLGGGNYGRRITTDAWDNIYVTGETYSRGWTAGGFDTSFGNEQIFDVGTDAFAAKFTPSGRRLWSTYLGGSANEKGSGIAVNGAGELYLAGTTADDLFLARVAQNSMLIVSVDPAFAAEYGAQWRFAGSSAWHDPSEILIGLAPGTYGVEFKPLPGWDNPTSRSITLAAGQTIEVTGSYGGHLGALHVTLSPAEAVAAGAKWRRAGTTRWLNSDVTENGVPRGTHAIEFGDVTYWHKPAAAVAVQEGKTSAMEGRYLPQLDLVLTSPAIQAVPPGRAVTLGVTATGKPPITYQWLRNGMPLAGATQPSLALSGKVGDEGLYTCQARNAYLQTESAAARVIVNAGSEVLAYLLGLPVAKTIWDLDLNLDGQVNVSDVICGTRHTVPEAPGIPNPASGQTGVSRRPRLDWSDCARAQSYELYLWPAGSSRPAAPGVTRLAVSQWDVNTTLSAASTWRWQVVARGADASAAVSGPVWSFTTK